MPLKGRFIVGIDTSCDDTSVGILQMTTKEVLANVVSSQVKLHAPHGGVVPELASRSHMENLSVVFDKALDEAGIRLDEIGAVAVTKSPGLIGCLLVGTSFAKALAYRLGVPLYGVNHLEGHLFSPFIGKEVVRGQLSVVSGDMFPFLGLVVSGGHTAFYRVNSFADIRVVGQTVDDAAGEAFDKTAKMLGLGYPGGPVIDKRARKGAKDRFPFTIARVKMGQAYLSFSGLKTAAYQYISRQGVLKDNVIDDICASVQNAIVETLVRKVAYFLNPNKGPTRQGSVMPPSPLVPASKVSDCAPVPGGEAHGRYHAFTLSGGVGMNSLLRRRVAEVCEQYGVPCLVAAPQFCTDNGAMIAYAALLKNCRDEVFTLETLPSRKINARRLKNETPHPPKAQTTLC